MMSRFVCLFVVGACGVTDFDIDQPIPEQRVQGSPLPGPLATLFPVPLNLDLSSQIKARDTARLYRVVMRFGAAYMHAPIIGPDAASTSSTEESWCRTARSSGPDITCK